MCEQTIGKTMVKICGLRRPKDVVAVNRLEPDLAGFILSPGYRRTIYPEQAQILRQILSPRIRTVGVFVDAPFQEILQAAEGGWIDMIQLHGKEDETYIQRLSALTDLPLIKAFRIQERKDLEAAAASPAEWILLDSGTGTGRRFDWDLLEGFLEEHGADTPEGRTKGLAKSMAKTEDKSAQEAGQAPRNAAGILFPGGHPWLLAGGLSAENVRAAIGRFHPTAVDVSSKVETDGCKDPEKMQAFLAAARMETGQYARAPGGFAEQKKAWQQGSR